LISIDSDIENDLKVANLEEKKRLRALDATFKASAKKDHVERVSLTDAENTAAIALGISLSEYREKYAPKKAAAICPTHNVEMKSTVDGPTCQVCDALEVVANAMKAAVK
jgi:hypothetical protein